METERDAASEVEDHYSAVVPINWEARSTVARNSCAQSLADHLPVLTHLRLLEKNGESQHGSNSALKGWRPKTESDACGFGRVIVGSLEAVEDITECIPEAARAVEFESAGREKQFGKEDNRTS